jgi:hypothetical protein
MNVLIDTPVWSIALRRRKQRLSSLSEDSLIIEEFKELIQEMRVVIIGQIRQEILSGISDRSQFVKLRNYLRSFQDLQIDFIDYERAAEFYNLCRRKGIQGSHVDFLICSIAERHNLPIFTTDKDFILYAKHLHISVYKPRNK